MADKIKRISTNAFEKAVNSIYEPTTIVDWNGLSIVVKRHLSLSDVAHFVDVCTKACYNAEDNLYAPEAKDLAIRSCIILFYTNITLPSNLERQCDLIYHSSILELIIPCIDKTQLDAVIRAIEEKIDYLVDTNTDFAKKQINELANTFNNLQNQMEKLFSEISQEDLKGVINAFSNASFDEEKLVKAYFENNK